MSMPDTLEEPTALDAVVELRASLSKRRQHFATLLAYHPSSCDVPTWRVAIDEFDRLLALVDVVDEAIVR
jgi:hypothetical protein